MSILYSLFTSIMCIEMTSVLQLGQTWTHSNGLFLNVTYKDIGAKRVSIVNLLLLLHFKLSAGEVGEAGIDFQASISQVFNVSPILE